MYQKFPFLISLSCCCNEADEYNRHILKGNIYTGYTSVVSDSVRPHRRQPTRLPRPWESPGKNTAVGCHFLLQWVKVKSESEVAQPCPTLSDPTDCSPPGSSVHRIFQARALEWGAIAFSIVSHKALYLPSSPRHWNNHSKHNG